MSDFSPEALGAVEAPSEEKKKKKKIDTLSPEALGASEVSPESLGAVAVSEEPTTTTGSMKSTVEDIKSGKKKLSPEQLDKMRELLRGAPERMDTAQKENLQAAGLGILQGLPAIGTWSDEALELIGADKGEIDRLLQEHPNISTTAEVLTALAIPIPTPTKLGLVGKLVGAGLEGAATGSGAAKEGERTEGALLGSALSGGLTGAGHLLAKSTSKAGGLVKDARLKKEATEQAAEQLKNPKTLLGLEDPNLISNGVKKAQQKFNIPTEQIEEVATRYGVTENPQRLQDTVQQASKQLDEAYDVVDESVNQPIASFLDDYMERFRKEAAVVPGTRTRQSIKEAENKLAKAQADLESLQESGARSVDTAVMEDRVEKLTDEVTAVKVKEKMRNIYKSTLKHFNELADAADSTGSTSLRELVGIKNQLFKEAGNNEAKLALAYDFNNTLQEYVEKNAPEHLLGPWNAAKKDWSTLTLIDSQLGKTLSKNYEKAYGTKIKRTGSAEDISQTVGSLVRAGYALKNLATHPVLFTAGMGARSLMGAPLEKAGDLAEKVLQSKKLPSRGIRSLEHILQQRERERK